MKHKKVLWAIGLTSISYGMLWFDCWWLGNYMSGTFHWWQTTIDMDIAEDLLAMRLRLAFMAGWNANDGDQR